MVNNGTFCIDFNGDYGYEMSEAQQAELAEEFKAANLSGWTLEEIALVICGFVNGDCIKKLSTTKFLILDNGYTVCSVSI